MLNKVQNISAFIQSDIFAAPSPPVGAVVNKKSLKFLRVNTKKGSRELPIALMAQYKVTVTLVSPEVILPICFLPSPSNVFP